MERADLICKQADGAPAAGLDGRPFVKLFAVTVCVMRYIDGVIGSVVGAGGDHDRSELEAL